MSKLLATDQGHQVGARQRFGDGEVVDNGAGRFRQGAQVLVDHAGQRPTILVSTAPPAVHVFETTAVDEVAQIQRVAKAAPKELVGVGDVQCRVQRRLHERRGLGPVERLDGDPGEQVIGPERSYSVRWLGLRGDGDHQPRRPGPRQLVHQGGRQRIQVVRVVDHQQQIASITGQGTTRRPQQRRGPPNVGSGGGQADQMAESAERDGPPWSGSHHPASPAAPAVLGHDLLGSQLRQQRLADAVWPDQHHPAPIRTVDGRLHVFPDAHRRILWRLRPTTFERGIGQKCTRFTSVVYVLVYVGENRHYR